MSGAARRLDRYHVHMGVGSEWLTSGPLVLRAVLKCVLGQRCHVQMRIPVSIRAGVPAAHRRRQYLRTRGPQQSAGVDCAASAARSRAGQNPNLLSK